MRRSLLRVLAAATAPVAAMACTRSAPDQTAAPTPQITLEQVLSIADAGAPAWSPDGRRLAFSWGTGTQRNLWVADADATTPGRPGDTSLQQIAPLVARGGAVVSPDWRRHFESLTEQDGLHQFQQLLARNPHRTKHYGAGRQREREARRRGYRCSDHRSK